MPLAPHHSPDPLYRAEHALRVAVGALARIDVDTIPPGWARRFASLHTETAVLADELTGIRVTYRRGELVIHGHYLAAYSTDDTIALRTSDGHLHEVSAYGKFDLRRREPVARRRARMAVAA